MELNSGNLRSQCEAVVVLQGLMSSQGGTSTGGVTRGCDRFGTSQDLSAKSHDCYGT